MLRPYACRKTSGVIMPDDMGTFRVDVEIENPARPGERRALKSVLVDTGAELSWVPAEVLESLDVERNNKWRFRQADGTTLERWTGGVSVYVAGKRAAEDRKSTRLNSSHVSISYAVFCLKKKKHNRTCRGSLTTHLRMLAIFVREIQPGMSATLD